MSEFTTPSGAPAQPIAQTTSYEKEKSGSDVIPTYEYDAEQAGASQLNAFGQRKGEELKRGLDPRHVGMISIAGVIGTGLFLGTGGALANGGPLGLLLGYTTVGTVALAVTLTAGEMCSYLPLPGGHIKLAERFVDRSFSAVVGWNYWYNWVIIYPTEMCAAANLFGYWLAADRVNPAVWVTVITIIVLGINFSGPRTFGEVEYWMAWLKIILIIGLIILSFLIDVGAVGGGAVGFRYWRNPGAFVQYRDITPKSWGEFLGYFRVLIQAGFSYIGTEIIAIAAGETKNPRVSIPRATKNVYVRILVFYVLGTLAISVIVPSNNPNLTGASGIAASPFVIAIKAAGIKALPSIVNACVISSAASAASSDVYVSSRALAGLAITGDAPRIFARTNRHGVPIYSLAVTAAVGLLAFMVSKENAYKVFNYFVNLTSIAGLSTWAAICFIYIRFHKGMKEQGIDRNNIPFKSPLQPYLAYYGLVWSLIIILFSGFTVFLKGNWDSASFVTNYLTVALFPIIWLAFKFLTKSKMVAPKDMDFHTGLKEIIEDSEEEEPPTTILGKILRFIA